MGKKKILIADDDIAIIEAITMILEDSGYEITSTIDGNKVLEIQGKLPDLILLDIWMSGMDGRDICRYLKSKEKTKHIPLIMISANRDIGQIAKESGADGFIEKPFEMDVLLNTIKKNLM